MSTDSATATSIFLPEVEACSARLDPDEPHRLEIIFNRPLTGDEFVEISSYLTHAAQGWRPPADQLCRMVKHAGGDWWFAKGAPELDISADELLGRAQ